MRQPRLRWFASLLALAMIATACGGADDTDTTELEDTEDAATEEGGDDAAEEAGDEGGGDAAGGAPADAQLVIDRSFDLRTNDPHRQFEATGTILHHATHDTLLGFPTTDITEPQPIIAESYEVNDDATEFVFQIREDVVFSDGTPLTAADVAFSLQRIVNLAGNPSFIMAGTTTEQTGDFEVTITTEEPNPGLPYILTNSSTAIVNSELVTENGGSAEEDASETDTAEEWFNTESLAGHGSGPYVVESFDLETEVVLVRNENYWGEAPEWPRVVLRNNEAATQRLNIQSGESQLALDISGDDLAGLPDSLTLAGDPAAVTFFVFANQNPEVSEVTSNPDFVEAVRYGIDYDAVAELAGESARQACGILPDMLLGGLPDEECVTRDLDRAIEAFERSGVGDTPVELEYPSDFSANGLTFGPLAERVQANLAEVGINIELAPAPIATALDNYREGVEEMGLWLWNAGYPEPSYYLAFSPGELVGLRAGWAEGSADEVNDLGVAASQIIDNEERGAAYQEWERALQEQGPYLPLIQPSTTLVADPIVTNVEFHPTYIVDIGKLGYGG
ncbi:MAG: ABC transporter substrate-binding protein [Nitriliruptoraceae bacterium]